MKKGLLVAVLAVLVLFCLLAVGLGGFFGYRWYKGRAVTEEARMEETVLPAQPQEEVQEEEPGPSETQWAEPPTAEPMEGPKEETVPARPKPPAEGSPRLRPQPSPAEGSPEPPPFFPPTQEPSPVPPDVKQAPPAVEPAPPPAPKVPKGTLGLIFEGKIDEGQVTLTVDGEVWASEPFTASSERRFRLEKSRNLLPGAHHVQVSVSTPAGKTYQREWTAQVVEHRSTVWKAEMNRFPKELEVKPIAQ